MANAEQPRPTDEVLAAMRPTRYAFALLGLFVFVGMTEGYDVQAMALAAPLVATQWSLAPTQIGWLLSVSILGLVAGSFLLSPLGDRVGRRPSIVIALFIAGLATAAGAIAPDRHWLSVIRFVAGLGLGLALPNVTALAMELMPARLRTFAVILVSCGYPLGGALGGAVAGQLIPLYGHSAVFAVGGAATLVAMLLCLAFAPESPMFLIRKAKRTADLRRLLKRLGVVVPALATQFILHEAAPVRSRVSALFAPECRTATILLWLINFANMALVYYFVSWLPSLFVSRGLGSQFAVTAASLFSGSGVAGGLLMVFLLPRLGPTLALGTAYVIAIASSLTLASFDEIGTLFLATLGVAGATIVGSQFGLTAVVNQFYPSDIRVTASGYATGMGRLGAVCAPLAGAAILSIAALAEHAFAIAAVPAAIALIAIIILHRGYIDKSLSY